MRGLWWGDAHFSINTVGDQRAEKIGKLARKCNVDYVWQAGDFLTCDSVNPHNHKGSKKSKEAPYIGEELEILNNELKTFKSNLNPKQSKKKSIPYFQSIGNHTYWFKKYEEDHPEVSGMLYNQVLEIFAEYANVVSLYGEMLTIDNIDFTHCPVIAGRRIDGKYSSYRAGEYATRSLVIGHTHRKEVITLPKLGRDAPIEIINVGCSLLVKEDWIDHDSAENWSYGIFLSEHTQGRIKKLEWISMEEVMGA